MNKKTKKILIGSSLSMIIGSTVIASAVGVNPNTKTNINLQSSSKTSKISSKAIPMPATTDGLPAPFPNDDNNVFDAKSGLASLTLPFTTL